MRLAAFGRSEPPHILAFGASVELAIVCVPEHCIHVSTGVLALALLRLH